MSPVTPSNRPARRVVTGCLLSLALIGPGRLELPAGDWPRWRGPSLNGISTETGWSSSWDANGPRTLWKASVGTGFSSMAVASGRVFTLGNKDGTDTVVALDALSGRELWKHSYPCSLDPKYYEGGPGATPTVEGDTVYTLSKRGHLFALETTTGRVRWQKDLIAELEVVKPEWGFAGSPLVEGNLLVLNVGGAGTAVDKRTGKVVWTSNKEMAGYATAVPYNLQGERAVAIFSARALVGVRVSDGKELWRHPWVTGWDINAADPIVVNGHRLFISSFDAGAALLELTAGPPRVVWQNKEMGNHFNSCVLLDGFVYGVNGNTDKAYKDLRCLDVNTGAVRWKHEGLGLGSLMAADGRLIVLGEKGELAVAPASPTRFEPSAHAQVIGGKCWTVPVLANGLLYCRNARGDLVCLDPRK